MGFKKSLDDIERERAERDRKEFKEDVKEDFKDIFGGIFDKSKKIKRKLSIFKWLGIILLFLFVVTLILGFVWLLRELITSLFFGG